MLQAKMGTTIISLKKTKIMMIQGRKEWSQDLGRTMKKLDLLKDIKRKQVDKKKVKKEDGKEGEEGTAGETDGGAATNEGDEQNDDEKFLDEDTGSVASSTKSLMKHLRMLRNALYENYSPPSITKSKVLCQNRVRNANSNYYRVVCLCP